MRVIFCGQVPKDANHPESTEDVVEISNNANRIAVSDGASESFDSKTWAQLLVGNFARSPELGSEWLSEVVRQYSERYDLSTLSWSKHAAFERGSFATLLGVEAIHSSSAVNIVSVGDSLAVLLSNAEMVDSFPYTSSQQFQQRPELFCTNPSHNGFIEKSDFLSRHYKEWCIKQLEKPTVLCMTDALGEWALTMAQEGEPQWATLLSITEETQLQSIVFSERQNKRMRVDDVTLVTIEFDGVSTDELSHS